MEATSRLDSNLFVVPLGVGVLARLPWLVVTACRRASLVLTGAGVGLHRTRESAFSVQKTPVKAFRENGGISPAFVKKTLLRAFKRQI